MAIHKLPHLRSDRVWIRRGYGLDDDRECMAIPSCSRQPLYRVAIAINTHYPEVYGGYYFNRRVLKVIGEHCEMLNLHFCLMDILGSDPIPAEDAVSLEPSEEYAIIDAEGKVAGQMMMWYCPGGQESFCADRMVLDFRLPLPLSGAFESELVRCCLGQNIVAEILPDAPCHQGPRRGILESVCRVVRSALSCLRNRGSSGGRTD